MLRNGIRNLLNLVPGHISQHQINDVNWLQPLEILGGRSMVQLNIGSKELKQKLDYETLGKTYKDTLFKNFLN